jgi:hypothetical protein
MAQIEFLSILKRIGTHPLFLLIVGFAVILAAIVAPQALGQYLAPFPGRSDWVDLLISIASAVSCIAAYLGFNKFIERRLNTDLTLPDAAREWGMGAFLGFGAIALTIGVIAAFGGYQVIGSNGPSILVAVLSMAIVSGIVEEILLRGVVFRLVEQWLGSATALLFSAALFGFLHIANPNSSWLAAFAIALEAGILLGAIYMLTRRLWAAIGLHMMWNAAQGGIFGVNVSGTDVPGLLISEMSGPELLTGGQFGAEASLPAMLICTALGLFILWKAYRKGEFIRASWARFKTGRDDYPGNL